MQVALALLTAVVASGAAAVAVPPLPLRWAVYGRVQQCGAGFHAALHRVRMFSSTGKASPAPTARRASRPISWSTRRTPPPFTVNAPGDSSIYGSFAGHTLPYVVVICHPTNPGNPRLDYALPTGRIVPHMQRGAEAPIWPDATTRYPVLLFSHGYGGSPLSNDYIYALTVFASFGFASWRRSIPTPPSPT